MRAGEGPGLIHAHVTRPYSHSSADSQAKYRDAGELAEELAHDPIDTLERELVGAGVLTEADAAALRADARDVAAAAAEEALAAPRPDPATITDNVVRLPSLPEVEPDPLPASADAEPMVMADAIRLTLHELLAADERIRVFGEDVADADDDVLDHVEGKGGVFGVTRGLQRRFGSARCYNTPLAESNIIGRGVGQALRGLRPCAEIQFFDYIWPAMQQLHSEAATIRWRSNGDFTCPLVVRVAIGGYLTGGAIWHSQSGESIFAHIPGLLVAFPSRARDAVGLLRSAFAAEDPVLFLEHKHLYRQRYAADPIPRSGWVLPFGRGTVARPGRDLTIVTWGATVQKSLVAAEELVGRRVFGRSRRPPHHLALGPRPRGRVGAAHRAAPRRPRGHPHRRVRSRGGGLGGRALFLGPRRARDPAWRPRTPSSATSPHWNTPSSPRSRTSSRRAAPWPPPDRTDCSHRLTVAAGRAARPEM